MNKILKTLKLISAQAKEFKIPSVTVISLKNDPYQVLISCILSLRTKDKVTIEASRRLFDVADTPEKMAKLPLERLERIIYPVGFYRNKAKAISALNKRLIEEYGSKVPATLEDLLKFNGVGRKTANLVLGLGYNIPAICVDTHVHRITNRLGWVRTEIPEETESALKGIIPERLWIGLNTTLVTFGQNICVPVSPYCSKCQAYRYCKRAGVDTWR